MPDSEKPPGERSSPWIVCVRRFEVGSAALYAFSIEEQAYMLAARIVRAELETLLELDEQNGRELLQALREGQYETALAVYHAIEGNLDMIDIVQVTVDQFQSDEPLDLAEFA
jgi:hypothetical protein